MILVIKRKMLPWNGTSELVFTMWKVVVEVCLAFKWMGTQFLGTGNMDAYINIIVSKLAGV